MKLHRQGVYPIARLVLATIPRPLFRSLNIVAEAVRLARHELPIEPYEAYRAQARPCSVANGRTNFTYAETRMA
jgi:hypothetical protein